MMANINGLYHSFKRKRTLRIGFLNPTMYKPCGERLQVTEKKKLEENTKKKLT